MLRVFRAISAILSISVQVGYILINPLDLFSVILMDALKFVVRD